MLIPAWLKDPRRHRAVFVLALPMVFSNVTTPLLGLVDTWVIGHLGQAWFLGGVSVGATFINLLFWLLGFLRMSTTGLTAQAQGAAHAEGQLDTLARALGLAIGLGMALLLLLLPFLPAIIALGGGSSEVQTYAGQYVSVRVWSAPAALCNLVIMGWLLGMQDARSPMLLLILGNLVNMVLDAWFVLGLGWQVKGVAAASLLADYSTLGVGFEWDDKRVKRAGLDYHEFADVKRWPHYEAFLAAVAPQRVFACTTKGRTAHSAARFAPGDALLFGPESRGLPMEIIESLPFEQRLRIPMLPQSRSMNLANAVAVFVYESWRQFDYSGSL